MPRRPAHPTYDIRLLAVDETAVSFSYSGHGKASHAMLITGEVDEPVLRTHKLAITVLQVRGGQKTGANAIGVTGGVWRIVASINERDFATLLTLVAGRLLAFGELSTEPIRHGRGQVHSINFSTTRTS